MRNSEVKFAQQKKGKGIDLEVKSGATQKLLATVKKPHEPDKVLLVANSLVPWEELLKSRFDI